MTHSPDTPDTPEALADGDASRLPWITYNPGDLFRDRVNIICPGADVIIVANIEIHTARLIVAEHNAALRPAAPAPSEPVGGYMGAMAVLHQGMRELAQKTATPAPVSAGVDLDGLLATWTGLIESAEADFAEDMAEAETTGERPDLWQYKLEVGLDDARDLITFLTARSTLTAQPVAQETVAYRVYDMMLKPGSEMGEAIYPASRKEHAHYFAKMMRGKCDPLFARKNADVLTFNIGDQTMAKVFKPSGLTDVSDWQKVMDAVEVALTPAPVDTGLDALISSAKAEAQKAMQKFPQPNYVISKVAEEAGEVVKAAIHCAEGRETPEAVIGEIKQAMAMLIRLYIEGDQIHGLPPLRAQSAPVGGR